MYEDHHHRTSTGLSPSSLSELDDLSELESDQSFVMLQKNVDLTVDVDSDIEDGLENGAFLYDEDADAWGQIEDIETRQREC